MANKVFKCPLCKNKYTKDHALYDHIEKDHKYEIPEDFSPSRFVHYSKYGKTSGTCVSCKKPTLWNEATKRYKMFCENPKCVEDYKKMFKNRMIGKYGKTTLLDDPEHQRKMLANRKISGNYTWSDGGVKSYTGSYELDFLRFLDVFMNFKSSDIITPSPHTYYYEYEKVKKFYIPDIFIPSLHLEIEIKDGGDNENKHHKIQAVDKVKEKLKDEVMASQKQVKYIKVVNKQYGDFLEYLNLDKVNN